MYLVASIAVLINLKNLKCTKKNFFGFIVLVSFLLISFSFTEDLIHSMRIIRLYFGFVIFYIFFGLYDFKKINLKIILIILMSWLFAEILLINTILDQALIVTDFRDTKFFGFYYRPTSFNTNPTSTAGILVILYYFVENILKEKLDIKFLFLFGLCIFLILSTTGYIMFMVCLVLRFVFHAKNKLRNFLLIVILFVLIYYLSMLFPANVYGFDNVYYNFEKISGKYVGYIYEFKKLNIEKYLFELSQHNLSSTLLFGSSKLYYSGHCENAFILIENNCFLRSAGIGGDFGIINALYQLGIFGTIALISLFFLFKNNKLNYVGLYFLFIVSSLHYTSIFMPMGQIFIAYSLQKNLN
tara:strand:+ start:3064 stop:4131 length:1068 start_codon:yes stop_codon:yes gene_type:complete